MNDIPRPGERYRHFKNKYYQIVAIATHTETDETMVVYQALYGDFGVWVRPLSMFMEKVDRDKYPDADQEYRFERVAAGPGEGKGPGDGNDSGVCEYREEDDHTLPYEDDTPMNALLLDFLDTDSTEERLALLQKMKGKVGQREVDSLCFCLDVQPMEGELEDQLDSLKQYLKMQQRYDASRLRRS